MPMRRYKPNKEDAPTRIIQATLALIAEKGSDALRTREILERAGVSNLSAISYYFGSLDNLRLQALERYFEGIRLVLSGLDDEDDPRQALLEYCRRIARFVLANPSLERNVVFLAMSGEQPNPVFARVLGENIRTVQRLILRGRQDQDQEKAVFDAIAFASATIYPLLLAAYGLGSIGVSVHDEQEREKYYSNLVDRLLGAAAGGGQKG